MIEGIFAIFESMSDIYAISRCNALKNKKVDDSHQIIVKYIAAIFYIRLMRQRADKRRALEVQKIMVRHHFHNLFRQSPFVVVRRAEGPRLKGVNLSFTRYTVLVRA